MRDDKEIYGIQELYRPANGEAEVDIVAIHGLNGGAIKSWSADEKLCWLSHPDFLPKYIKQARVLVWGYNANISSLTGRSTCSDRILQHAQTLVTQLYADRDLEDAIDRPIIFLCHSLGGIIVKRALAYSASRSACMITTIHSIYTCTFAVMFFGTPHSGSSKARLLGSLQKLASIAVPNATAQFDSSLVAALTEDSETLQNITDQFAPLMSRFRIFFFWEQEKTDLKYKKDYIVDQSSAAPIFDNTERSGIAADHRGMCKFKKNTDQGFRTTVAALRRYCVLAPRIIQERRAQEARILSEMRTCEAMELLGNSGAWQGQVTVPVVGPHDMNNVHQRQMLEGSDSRSFGVLQDVISEVRIDQPVILA